MSACTNLLFNTLQRSELHAAVDSLSFSTVCLQVQVDKERKLIINGERKKEETQMDAEWRQKKTERRFGAFQRKFQLPENADVNKITGKAENGILSITISKIPMEDVPSDSTRVPIY